MKVDHSSTATTVPAVVATSPGAVGQLVIRGRFHTPNSGYQLTGHLRSIVADTISLVVHAEMPDGVLGLARPWAYDYTAKVDDLPSGSYHVRVIHERVGGSQYSEFVQLDTTVVIP